MRRAAICLTLFAILLGSFICAAQQPAAGDRASRDQIVKLMELLKCREQVNTTMDAITRQMLLTIHQQMREKDPKVSDAEIAEFDKIMIDYLKKLPFDEMFEAMIPVYEANFTRAEVGAMIDFYSSAVGQSILAKMPMVTVDAMKAMQPAMTKNMETLTNDMQKKMEELVRKYHPAPES